MSAYLAITALDGLVASGCVGLAIALCATMFARLAPLAQAAVVAKLALHSLFLIQMVLFPGIEVRLVWDVLHLVLVGLYTFARVTGPATVSGGGGGGGGVRGMDVLDWAFIAWAFLGHVVDFGARLAVRWVVVPRLFERYLRSFDGDAFRGEGRERAGGKKGGNGAGAGAGVGDGGGIGGLGATSMGAGRRGWVSRARLKLGVGLGGDHRYQEQAQMEDREMYPRSREEGALAGRPEQHLLKDMEGGHV